jgi:vitamin B12 transporter
MVGIAQQHTDSTNVEQLDEVVITDSRFALKRENSGKTVIRITAKEIENNQGRTIRELINTKSGIEINGSRSNAGQNLGVYVRGGRNRQVLVLIDGVQMGDPSQINNEYDFRLLNLDQVESIEIIKGAASTLYGSGAATAVINITTRKAVDKPIDVLIRSTLGTNQSKGDQNYNLASFNNNVALTGTLNKFSYRAAFNQQFADGISSAISDTNEKDPYSKYGIDLNMGYAFGDSFSLNIYGNLTEMDSDFDGGSFLDADNTFLSEQYRAGVSSTYTYSRGSLILNAAFSKYNREFISSFPAVYESKSYIMDLYNRYTFNNSFYTVLGVNIINSEADFVEAEGFNMVDPYVNAVYVSDFGLNLNLGARLNNHSEYGTHFTFNINPSYAHKFDDNYLKVLGSFSTSYITPSLSQLFGFFGPNPDLEPEENRTLEGGFEIKLGTELRASALYFNREETNVVIYDFDIGYFNATGKARTNGVELGLEVNPSDALRISANYTFVENKDEQPIRIPKHKANLLIGYDLSSRTFASISYQYTHDRLVNDFSTFPATPVTLDSFSLVNLYFSHSLNQEKIKVFAGMDNVLNEDFEDLYGFTTLGRNVRVGFRLQLL